MSRYAAAWLFVILASAALGQVPSGAILGTVYDSSGAVVPAAGVTLHHEDTGFQRVVETNSSGAFVAPSIPIGSYTIVVEIEGFQTLKRTGIPLTALDTVTVDLQLTVGSISEIVEVSSQAPLLQTARADVTNVVENKQIVDLPLNGPQFHTAADPGAGRGYRIVGKPQFLGLLATSAGKLHCERFIRPNELLPD